MWLIVGTVASMNTITDYVGGYKPFISRKGEVKRPGRETDHSSPSVAKSTVPLLWLGPSLTTTVQMCRVFLVTFHSLLPLCSILLHHWLLQGWFCICWGIKGGSFPGWLLSQALIFCIGALVYPSGRAVQIAADNMAPVSLPPVRLG